MWFSISNDQKDYPEQFVFFAGLSSWKELKYKNLKTTYRLQDIVLIGN
jgi:hypothetical protein